MPLDPNKVVDLTPGEIYDWVNALAAAKSNYEIQMGKIENTTSTAGSSTQVKEVNDLATATENYEAVYKLTEKFLANIDDKYKGNTAGYSQLMGKIGSDHSSTLNSLKSKFENISADTFMKGDNDALLAQTGRRAVPPPRQKG